MSRTIICHNKACRSSREQRLGRSLASNECKKYNSNTVVDIYILIKPRKFFVSYSCGFDPDSQQRTWDSYAHKSRENAKTNDFSFPSFHSSPTKISGIPRKETLNEIGNKISQNFSCKICLLLKLFSANNQFTFASHTN